MVCSVRNIIVRHQSSTTNFIGSISFAHDTMNQSSELFA